MPGLRLADDTVKVVLNTKGKTGEVSDDLKALLRYIGGHRPESPLTKELDQEVEKVKRSDEWGREFMTLYMRDQENIKIGTEIGKEIEKISSIRKMFNKNMSIDEIAYFLEHDPAYVEYVLELIENNPGASDADIAKLLMAAENGD